MRRVLYRQLDAGAWQGPGLSPVNRVVVATIILAVVVSILETEPTLVTRAARFFGIVDVVFGVAFSIEYLVRIWVAGEHPKFQGFRGRARYILSPAALIDLFALLPFLLTAGLQDAFLLRLFRVLRLLALAKFGRYSAALQNISTGIFLRRYELLISLFAAFIVMLLAASALHFTEGAHDRESFGSIPRALWWGVATVTKVGYGGAFPVTVLGKLFAALFAIAAIGVVAMPTGILAAAFSDAFQRERRSETSPEDERGEPK